MSLEEYIKYKEVEQFLESLVFSKPIPHFAPSKQQVARKNPLGLERIASFVKEAGNPHLKNKYIHVAGTSGKTSTTYFLANLLQAHGYRTGMFTSPHICTFAEYFMLNMQLPPLKEILALIKQTKPLIDREYEQKDMGNVSYFEFILSIAFAYFGAQQTDYVVLEAGLGGRYDATNVIEQSEAGIITNIGLDHTHILGNTLQEIAADKVGIMKRGSPLLTAERNPELLAIFEREAQNFETSVQKLGKDFFIEHVKADQSQTVFDYISEAQKFQELTTPVCGAYQAHNAALAIRSLELIAEKNGKSLDEEALRKGLRSTKIPARYEQVNLEPPVFLDGAHNPDKIRQFVSFLSHRFPNNEVLFVCGFTAGKDLESMFHSLLEVSRSFYITRVFAGYREPEDPLHLKSILTSLCPTVKATITLDAFAALNMAMDEARQSGKVVCVTGSLYLVSYLRQRWYPEYKVLQKQSLL